MEAGRRTLDKILAPHRPGASKTRATNAGTPLRPLAQQASGGLLPEARILKRIRQTALTLSPPWRSTLFSPTAWGVIFFS